MATAAKTLVIVESPSKAKTIGKYLGSRYKVVASAGHVRDLPASKLGIEIENDFEPKYINMRNKGSIIKELKAEAKKAGKIYLATDPDREGEAISWHLATILGLDLNSKCRIEFNEITKSAISEAIKNPRAIDMKLVDAQQARRVLDRLVGYQISPILWRKVTRGTSAGRVQSAALKIICDRENEINAFVPQEYWNLQALLSKKEKSTKTFTAKLAEFGGKKLTVKNEEEALAIYEAVEKGKFVVSEVTEKDKVRRARPPFTTSTLQQEGSSKLNFATRKTMMLAQQLYEGGHITYIRTDSVRVSQEARAAAKDFIVNTYGENYYAGTFYSNKKKDVQDAHEAIRPSHIEMTPEMAATKLDRDQARLYKLIWTRFMASQMQAAVFDSVNVDIENSGYTFKASGAKIKFDGYLKVYKASDDEDESKMLPPLEVGEELKCENLEKEQCFTQGPSRFNEASLVREMEEKNIGRPSTYAPTIATLIDRKYVSKKDRKSLFPTDLGIIVNDFMKEYFNSIVDLGFTADMEDKLDSIEVDNQDWKAIIRTFYGDFEKSLDNAGGADRVSIPKEAPEETGELCPECGKPLVYRHSRFGKFVACSGFPACTYKPPKAAPVLKEIGINCPKCGKPIVEKRSKRGKIFYGCSGYPDCDTAFWNKPVDKKCPECGSLLTETTRKNATLCCSNKDCGYTE